MMGKRLYLFAVLVLLAFTVIISCSTDTYPITIKPVLIAEGESFSGGEGGNFVIKTQAEWDNLVCSHYFGNNAVTVCNQDFADKNINFDMFQIIAVIDEVRPCGGWGINIVSIREYSDDIVVSIDVKAPKGASEEVLVFIMPDSLELAPGLERGASVQQSDIKSQQLRATLIAINVTSIARAFPEWDAADSITYNDRGEPVKKPAFHRVFILTFEPEQDIDDAIRKLNDLPAVVYAEKDGSGSFTLDNDPQCLDGTQWRSYQIVKIPVTAKDVIFKYTNK